jgi:hypothetical protein
LESLLEVAERVRDIPMMLEKFIARDRDRLGQPAARAPVNPDALAVSNVGQEPRVSEELEREACAAASSTTPSGFPRARPARHH